LVKSILPTVASATAVAHFGACQRGTRTAATIKQKRINRTANLTVARVRAGPINLSRRPIDGWRHFALSECMIIDP
jgi:hypothetical protein